MRNTIEIPSMIKKKKEKQSTHRCAKQRCGEFIKNSSSWAHIRDCFSGSLLLLVNILIRIILFLSLAKCSCKGIDVALPLNSAVLHCLERCSDKSPSQTEAGWSGLHLAFFSMKTAGRGELGWLKSTLRSNWNHWQKSLYSSLAVFMCLKQSLSCNADTSFKSCLKNLPCDSTESIPT